MNLKLKICAGLLLAAGWLSVKAEVRLPQLLSDGVVLQRNAEIKLWGSADAHEKIRVTFKKKEFRSEADADGNWTVSVPSQQAGGPYEIQINDKVIRNVWIGDVFLCSGQSNMELPISRVMDLYRDEAMADSNERIHYVKIPRSAVFHEPKADVLPSSGWQSLNPQSAPQWSAVCYFFAKEYERQNNVPVGIINSSVGGSPVEAWISADALKSFPEHYNDYVICQNDDFVASHMKLEGLNRKVWIDAMNKAVPVSKEWQPVSLFSCDWGMDGIRPINGLHRFRRTVRLNAEQAGEDAVLRMGCIVDADSIFVNGHFVGTTSYQYPPRIYPVASSYLKEGDNEIEIRLISYNGVPCFVPEKPYKLIFKDKEISLSDGWSHQLVTRMPELPASPTFHYKPVGLYNGMIAPLLNFHFTGAVWYQGESNVGRFNEYASLLETMMADWRARLNQPELPFAIVEIASFLHPQSPEQLYQTGLRRAQKEAAEVTPRAVLIPTTDLGEWNDIHPLAKKPVGKRIADAMTKLNK